MVALLTLLTFVTLFTPIGASLTLAAETPQPQGSGDWPQWGGSPARNNAPEATNLPVTWDIGKIDTKTGKWLGSPDKQIRWVARLGSQTYGSPVIADGQVYCATNNGAGYVPQYPARVDLGCLPAFAQADGRFLWQYSSPKLKAGNAVDYAEQGICCSPLVEGKRLWLVTNRGEVVCLDTESPPGSPRAPHVVWRMDMMSQLGVVQHYMCSCSVTAAGDLLLVGTSNGVNQQNKIPAPDAPSFIALDKHSGKLVWADHSPGGNILEGQWSSPAFGVLGGVPQAIFAGGDGWLYSFLAAPASDGKPRLLWKFDCNPKETVWQTGGLGTRNHIVATPLIYDGRIYIGTGQDPEVGGDAPGDLWCVDPTRRGDVSAELVLDKQGNPVPPRRLQAVDKEAGEQVRPNPNSAAVWHYHGHGAGGDDKANFKQVMHRTLGMAAAKEGLLVIGDFAGLLHCLDAQTGKPYWTRDVLSAIWGGPLIADGKIYIGDEDGDVLVFEFSKQLKQLKPLAKNNMGDSVYSTPVVAHNRLYIATRTHLFAIGP